MSLKNQPLHGVKVRSRNGRHTCSSGAGGWEASRFELEPRFCQAVEPLPEQPASKDHKVARAGGKICAAMRNAIRLAWVAILVHGAVMIVHGLAHRHLGVELSASQKWFVTLVIGVAPFLGGGLLLTRERRSGAILLFLAMTASLVFGVYYHFIFISADHVARVPVGTWRGAFQLTACLLVLTEAFGAWAALRAL